MSSHAFRQFTLLCLFFYFRQEMTEISMHCVKFITCMGESQLFSLSFFSYMPYNERKCIS